MEASDWKFHHPYEPYDIQLQFMQKLYQCIEDGLVGIFESPTGTGKSLSLICAALTWLRDDERRRIFGADTKNGELDWLEQAECDNQRKQLLEIRREYQERLVALRQNAERQRDQPLSKRTKIATNYEEQEILLDDYLEEDLSAPDGPRFSTATMALLDQLKPQHGSAESELVEDRTQIIFCSRTHSQLTQFVHEMRKIDISSGCSDQKEPEIIRHIPLGSRKNLCINLKVKALSSVTAINERCLELQKPGVGEVQKCEYLPKKNSITDEQRIDHFKDLTVSQIADIEDVASIGRSQKLCPYYATRSAIPAAEVLTLPYPLLLQRKAREALGIRLKDNVVIIDEAHNLTSAVADTIAVSMPLSHLDLARKQLLGYCQKFKNKLKGLNRVYLAQLIKLLKKWIELIEREGRVSETVLTPDKFNDMNESTGQISISKILRYVQESKIVFKVEAYAELTTSDGPAGELSSAKLSKHRPRGVLAEFQNLLVATLNSAQDGRFIISQAQEPTIKYLLLDPQTHFQEIVREARSVILAGGTMSPLEHWSDELFPYLEGGKLKTYSFDHIIESTNVLVESLVSGPSNAAFDFKYGTRNSESMLLELGSVVERLCHTIPDGIVAFFPSYDYLAMVMKTWKTRSRGLSIYDKIAGIKAVFQEERNSNTDELLASYTTQVMQGKGAVLFAIVGGKLSEGINFADKLGRGVVCVGLPYPNVKSIEWSEKVRHVEGQSRKRAEQRGLPPSDWDSFADKAGREYADTITMRAVNQSIGRAIRHKNDYAAIFLVDKRFATPRIQQKLPAWLRKSITSPPTSWNSLEKRVATFFTERTE